MLRRTPGPAIVRGFLSSGEIDDVLEIAANQAFRPGGVTGSDPTLRQCLATGVSRKSWVAHALAGAVRAIVQPITVPHWGSPQLVLYEPGMKFDWHKDSGTIHGYRLFTGIIEVQSAPGARLEIRGFPDIVLNAGDLVVFPASCHSRDTSPSSGNRVMLWNWFSEEAPVPRSPGVRRPGEAAIRGVGAGPVGLAMNPPCGIPTR